MNHKLIRRPRAFVIVATLAAACSSSTEPFRLAGPPDEFKFELGGFGAGSRTVALRNDTVLYYRRDFFALPSTPIDTIRVVPSADAWRDFWAAAEGAGIHRWKARYVSPGVVDGEGWSLRVVNGDRRVESSGNNAYPDRLGGQHFERTTDFSAFIAALSTIVGVPVSY